MFDASAVLHGYIHEGIAAVVLSVTGWILIFPVRTFFGAVKTAWDGQVDTLREIRKELVEERLSSLRAQISLLEDVKEELEMQRIKFLAGIVTSTEKQVDLLERVAETLTDMHLDQRELLGKLNKNE